MSFFCVNGMNLENKRCLELGGTVSELGNKQQMREHLMLSQILWAVSHMLDGQFELVIIFKILKQYFDILENILIDFIVCS